MKEYIRLALAEPLLSFHPDAGVNPLIASGALLILLESARRGDEDSPACIARAAEHLHHFVADGSAVPPFTLGPIWAYCPLAAAIALAKETPAVWDLLTDEEREKYDFIAVTLARLLAFATADDNDYRTGPSMRGNYCKNWNPNYRLAVVTPMIFLSRYLGGAAALDAHLASFSYDETVAKFKKYGMTRAVAEWTVPAPTLQDGTKGPTAKDFLENGGPAYLVHVGDATAARLHNFEGKPAGSGKGVRVKYLYHGNTADQANAILTDLLHNNFSGGAVISCYGTYEDGSPKAYILDGTKSPYEGQMGMMKEFASGDGNGIRSGLGYCSHDFVMICGALLSAKELQLFDLNAPENAEIAALAKVGCADFLYKAAHGYMSFTLGHAKENKPHSCGGGCPFWKDWWQENYGA